MDKEVAIQEALKEGGSSREEHRHLLIDKLFKARNRGVNDDNKAGLHQMMGLNASKDSISRNNASGSGESQ